WAKALAAQDDNLELKERFAALAKTLEEQQSTILAEMTVVQGKPVDIGGYYHPDVAKATKAMRPSDTFNSALDNL
ncbi:NADP-dependent isocitrate dehydrogenase, partial [Oleiphilus sp. HI0086]